MNANDPTAPKQIKAREREVQALALRLGGATYEQIGKNIGITTEGARKAVRRALDKTQAEVDDLAGQLRELERQRLEALIRAATPQAMRGHLGAIETVRKLSESLRKLQGLDAPAKQEFGFGDEEFTVTIGGVQYGQTKPAS